MAQSILHRNPVDIGFGSPAHWQPAGESAIPGHWNHPSENLNSSRRIRVRVEAFLHPTRNPVVRVMEFGSPAQPESMSDPLASESSRHRIRVRISGPVHHPSESESHRIRVRVGGPVYSPSKSCRHRILFAGLLESMILRNPVVIEFGSESAAQSPVYHPSENSSYRIRVRVGGPTAAQSILPGHPLSPSHRTHHFKLSKFRRHPFRPGRQSGLGRGYHPPNQCLSSIQIQPGTVVIEFRLSIIHRPGPRFAHRSLDPPSESEGAPSTDLVMRIS